MDHDGRLCMPGSDGARADELEEVLTPHRWVDEEMGEGEHSL
jgi:hypothetical protein